MDFVQTNSTIITEFISASPTQYRANIFTFLEDDLSGGVMAI